MYLGTAAEYTKVTVTETAPGPDLMAELLNKGARQTSERISSLSLQGSKNTSTHILIPATVPWWERLPEASDVSRVCSLAHIPPFSSQTSAGVSHSGDPGKGTKLA